MTLATCALLAATDRNADRCRRPCLYIWKKTQRDRDSINGSFCSQVKQCSRLKRETQSLQDVDEASALVIILASLSGLTAPFQRRDVRICFVDLLCANLADGLQQPQFLARAQRR